MKYHIGKTIIEGIEYRKCRDCREVKILNLDNFVKRNTKNGWRGKCKICYNKNKRAQQEVNNTERVRYKKYRNHTKSVKPLNYLFLSSRGNSKRVNREFNITVKDLENLWELQKGLCYYTNKPMLYDLGSRDSVSIDRIDSSKGYILGNIALCMRQVNTMKNDATLNELFEFCELVMQNKETILNR